MKGSASLYHVQCMRTAAETVLRAPFFQVTSVSVSGGLARLTSSSLRRAPGGPSASSSDQALSAGSTACQPPARCSSSLYHSEPVMWASSASFCMLVQGSVMLPRHRNA